MRPLIFLLSAALLALGLLVALNRSLQDDLTTSTRQRNELTASLEQRNQLVTALTQQIREREQAELSLRQSLNEVNQLTQTREQKIQRLLNENKTLRDWANTPLPIDISRLHQRPAFSSSRDYLRWLPDGEPMPDPGQSTKY